MAKLAIKKEETAYGICRLHAPNKRAILQQFPAEIEGNVFAVDNSSQESQPLREQVFGLMLHEHFSAVQRHSRFASGIFGHFQDGGSLFRHVEDAETKR